MVKEGRLRFIVISTHHYIFSGDPQTHQHCLDYISELGGHIVAEHTIQQSYSGDGLIVASFDKSDSNFRVEVSHNMGASLFRPYEDDLALLMAAYDQNK